MLRHPGIPLATDFFHNDILAGVVLLFCLFVCISIYIQLHSGKNYVVALIRAHNVHELPNVAGFEFVSQFLLDVFAMFGYALFACYHLPITPNWEHLGWLTAGSAVFIIGKYLLSAAFLYTFLGADAGRLIRLLRLIINLCGLCMFCAYILSVYTPAQWQTLPLVFAAISVLCSLGATIYLFFKGFLFQTHHLFHFILYLCTLEALPTAVLIRWLASYQVFPI